MSKGSVCVAAIMAILLILTEALALWLAVNYVLHPWLNISTIAYWQGICLAIICSVLLSVVRVPGVNGSIIAITAQILLIPVRALVLWLAVNHVLQPWLNVPAITYWQGLCLMALYIAILSLPGLGRNAYPRLSP